MSTGAEQEKLVELVACGYCSGPMVRGTGKCPDCATPEGGKEFPYIYRSEARAEVEPLFKWWAIWSVLIWVFSGFSLGKVSSVLLTAVAFFYLIRITRTWFAD